MFAVMTLREAQENLKDRLAAIYDSREAITIADWVMEHLTGWQKVDRVIHKETILSKEKIQQLENYTQQLIAHKPVQYVLNEAWFSGLKLYVDEAVLIPRPETEELVEWIATAANGKTILDVGTGSGCIPVALKKKFPGTVIYACDVSEKALQVAMKNATEHHTLINFRQIDFLHGPSRLVLPQVDILVSNPPYIPLKDKSEMSQNVVQYEPHIALFVQDNDPLIFYNALADFAQTHLTTGGSIFVEIHEELAKPVNEVFSTKGFAHIETRKDMQGKERMIKAAR
jgi:release factor glutamine methyltransferase